MTSKSRKNLTFNIWIFLVSLIRQKYPSADGKYVGFQAKRIGGNPPAKKRKYFNS